MAGGTPVRHQGELVEWSDEKMCGFIRPRGAKDGDPLVFVGSGSLAKRNWIPIVGSTLTYELVDQSRTAKRRLRTPFRAENAVPLGEEVPAGPDREFEMRLSWLGFLYVLALSALSPFIGFGPYILVVTLLASLVSFMLYWADKRKAGGEGQRVPEITLFLWSLLGGWPGAALAQTKFRHKTRKVSFRIRFHVMVVANVLLTAALSML